MPEGNGRPTQRVAAVHEAERGRPFIVPPQHFYRTAALPCPYVHGRIERKLVTELAGRRCRRRSTMRCRGRASAAATISPTGRPAPRCSACLPVRIPVADFALTRSLKRIRNLNRDLEARLAAPAATVEQFRLFLRYQRSRHADSDMAAMTYGDYRAMIEDSPVATRLVELRGDSGVLAGACLVDMLDDGLSAVYSFYDPDDGNRSLGNLLVLALVDRARQRALPYVYLGYLIKESPKMAYKARFRPLEALGPGGWRRIGAMMQHGIGVAARPRPRARRRGQGHDLLHVRLPLRHQGASEGRRRPLHRGQSRSPVNRGVLCAKGSAGIMQHYSPARLTRPLRAWVRAAAASSAKSAGTRRWRPRPNGSAPSAATIRRKLAFFTGRDQSQPLASWWASQFGTPNYAAHGGFCSVNMAAARLYTIGGSFREFGAPDWELTRCFLMFGVAEDHDSDGVDRDTV